MTVKDIASKISKDSNGCWIWNGAVQSSGYGHVRIKGIHRLIHRIIFESFNGIISQNLQLDHICKVRRCCGLQHLEPVTARENICRKIGKPQTHCKRGHAYKEVGYYLNASGSKTCKKCHADYYKNYRKAK